jgi:acyl-CoA thioesterase I
MAAGRLVCWLVAAMVLATAACSPTSSTAGPTSAASPPASTSASPGASAVSLVALGDSVPAGDNCDCTPYPQLSGQLLSTDAHTFTTANDAFGGATTEDVLRELEGGSDADRVGAADVVEVEVGANDVLHTLRCGTDVTCYSPEVPPMEDRLRQIVTRIQQLTKGRRVVVVLLDYWSVWLGGVYAQEQGDAYVAAAAGVTDLVNTAIRSTAQDTGSAYVDLRAAFKGPSYTYDETHFLSDDGDHPNAAGHEQIAKAVDQVVAPLLHG